MNISQAFPAVPKILAIGDTIFAVGAIALCWFVFGLKGGWSVKEETEVVPGKEKEGVVL